ncbi:hypothetical protein GXP67_07615 [Rhodocytophaga rosea]|uniref:Uncharacterized protein n=1 Tax=Rhodocytophaga rosea TaxID=2704465 RepID=A0A6C0GFI1_9BACT|nr:gliding motility-associated C-terminal domain-containing protein [Rhodocytophaga rosea]QHT66533.1 hypothetical protein GXP67_07615 [Rhodocytophaga rosea]
MITSHQEGFNETFLMPDLQENWSLSITNTNHWGKAVFETKNHGNYWSAQVVDAGMYFYFLHDLSSIRTFKGRVHVLRQMVTKLNGSGSLVFLPD